MGSRVRCFEATSLVDGYIYQYSARLHQFITGDQVRRFISRYKDRSYHQVYGRQFHFQA